MEDFRNSEDIPPSIVETSAMPLFEWSSSEWEKLPVYIRQLKEKTIKLHGDNNLVFPLTKEGRSIVMRPTTVSILNSLKKAFESIPAPSNRIRSSITEFLTKEEERQQTQNES